MSKTHVFLLIDRSGSMAHHWDESLSAVNSYINTLIEGKGLTQATIAVFDGESYDVLRNKVTPAKWTDITTDEAHPRGMTPLFDSVVKMSALVESTRAKSAVFVIMTDGAENCSKESTKADAKAAVERIEAKDFQVIFLGANFDSSQDAGAVGVTFDKNMTMTKGNYVNTFSKLASDTMSYSSGVVGSRDMSFTAEDRADATK